MPRMARIVIPNLPHRVTQRGNMASVPNGIRLRVFGPFSSGWRPAQPGRKAAPRPFGGWSAYFRDGAPGLILTPLASFPRFQRGAIQYE